MIHFIEIAPKTGRVLRSGGVGALEELPNFNPATHKFVASPVYNPNGVYWDGQNVRPIPPSPGDNYKFSYRLRAWILDKSSAWAAARAKRVALLTTADNTINRINDTGGDASAWRTYRQALRDITRQTDPFELTWPAPPVD